MEVLHECNSDDKFYPLGRVVGPNSAMYRPHRDHRVLDCLFRRRSSRSWRRTLEWTCIVTCWSLESRFHCSPSQRTTCSFRSWTSSSWAFPWCLSCWRRNCLLGANMYSSSPSTHKTLNSRNKSVSLRTWRWWSKPWTWRLNRFFAIAWLIDSGNNTTFTHNNCT